MIVHLQKKLHEQVKKALNKAEYGLQTAQNNNLKVKKNLP